MRLRPRALAHLLALPVVLALVACGGDDGPKNEYPPEIRAAFMSSCLGPNSGQAFCNCVFDGMQDAFTLDEFRAMEQRINRGQDVSDYNRIIDWCLK